MCCSFPLCCGGYTWAGDTSLPLLFLTLCPPFRRCQPPPALASPPYLQCDLAWSSSLVPFPPGHSCSFTQVFVMCSTPFMPLCLLPSVRPWPCVIILSHQHPPLPLQAPVAWPPAWGGERGPSETIHPPNPAFKGTQGASHCLQEVCVPLPCPVAVSERQAGPRPHCLAPVTSDYAICRSSKTLCLSPHHHLTSFFCVYFILFLWFLEQFKLPVYFHKRK